MIAADANAAPPLSEGELAEIEQEHTPLPDRSSGTFYCSCSEQIALAWPCFRARAAAHIRAQAARLADVERLYRGACDEIDALEKRVAGLLEE